MFTHLLILFARFSKVSSSSSSSEEHGEELSETEAQEKLPHTEETPRSSQVKIYLHILFI